jgi:transglutaminase/protease-like cytokinesis protein 3
MCISITRKLFSLLIVFLLAGSSIAQVQDTFSHISVFDAVHSGSKTVSAKPSVDYSKVDNYALSLKKSYRKIPDLAKDLAAPYSTDEEKIRSIFMWITANISYDCAEFHSKKDQSISFNYKTAAELEEKRKAYYYNYALKVLKNKKGICEGYAVLFQELCKANGIPCEIVIGLASDNVNKIERLKGKKSFSTNHAWNKVKIGNEWYYLDATWASGYCDKPVKKFYRELNLYYYLTPLNKLYSTHAENEKQTEKRNNVIAKSG